MAQEAGIPVVARMPVELVEALDDLATETGRSRSAVIRMALFSYLVWMKGGRRSV